MPLTIKMRESDDPLRGRQPKYEKLVMKGPGSFGMTTRLPSGEPIFVPLAPARFETRSN